jgi:NAD(P)-dependent dehydrogenase (short-subunit alcohol dehydrogenase family)
MAVSADLAVAYVTRSRCTTLRGKHERRARDAGPEDTGIAQPTHCRRYEGRVAVVTGAAQGLGRVIAKRLAEEGAKLVVCDIQEERLATAAQELGEETGMPFLAAGGDLSEPGVAEHMVEQALAAYGRIDTLVNNAAALIRLKLADFTEELMQKAVRWNVWNTLRCCKAVLPHMLERRYGRIVNIGGEAWRTGAPYHTLLAGIGKGSMIGLTITLAGETVRHGITVNCVSPGAIETEADGARNPSPAFARPAGPTPNFSPRWRGWRRVVSSAWAGRRIRPRSPRRSRFSARPRRRS